MKAILVKDNDFKTIGFEVTTNGVRVFNWGISPQPTNFTKEIDVNDWMIQIIDLIKIQAKLNEQREFIRYFFEIASGQKLINSVKNADPTVKLSVNFGVSDERMAQTERKIKNIIDNII